MNDFLRWDTKFHILLRGVDSQDMTFAVLSGDGRFPYIYIPSGVSILGRYPWRTSESDTSIAICCLFLALIFKILGKDLISDLRVLFASLDSESTNGIGVIGFDMVTKVLCLNEI